jgi:hypothetical protein
VIRGVPCHAYFVAFAVDMLEDDERTSGGSPAAARECKEVELINGTDADGTIDRVSSMSTSLLLCARD